ncbi:hypothetical protein BEN71_11085 [Acinetobacter wuhouensis]|uniref:hypothetical protein n=1 Tax=Acinetobacter TaxID=469 RepID=UPI00083A5ABC|nr:MULTISPECIES: hypothetical protein [Acinetobacter]AXQ22583.1 hypothetical protein BEN71_11085 [Acinetobacter wuhouensis]RZG76634.1 hypothetical protein EXE09_06265 [Acinetobacter sp. WCHAc060025]
MPKFIAKQSLGHFRPGDEIKGLEDKQLQALLVSGAIAEDVELDTPKANTNASQLTKLEAEVAELKVNETILIAGKEKAEAEVAELVAKVAGLEKTLATSQADLKKAQAEAKKVETATK